MKTKELIKQLLEADPSGEVECCVGNQDIFFVSKEPAYYDGWLQIIIRDSEGVIGAKITPEGHKVQIHSYSIADLLLDYPDLPIEFGRPDDHYLAYYERERAEAKSIIEKVKSEGVT